MNTEEQPQTNKSVIFLVVLTLAINATIGLCALEYCLVTKIQPDQVLLTAFISIITGLLGVLGGMLVKTSPTESIKQPLPNPPSPSPPPISSDNPLPVKVENQLADPVPTVEAK